jgi:hypothetical protein
MTPHETELHAQVEVPVPPDEAFRRFLDLGRWWPAVYSFSGEAGFAGGRIEPQAGGEWFERNRAGQRLSWGPVRMADAGRRLVLGWGVALDRTPELAEKMSEVDVDFSPAGSGTRVAVRHHQMNRHGEGWPAFHEAMNGPQGWAMILAAFAASCG